MKEINDRSLEQCPPDQLVKLFSNILDKPDSYAPKKMVINMVIRKLFDQDFYQASKEVCQQKLTYMPAMWEKSLYHLDEFGISEFLSTELEQNPRNKSKIFGNLISKLLANNNAESLYTEIVRDFTAQTIVLRIKGRFVNII